jgi:hypothetical protein
MVLKGSISTVSLPRGITVGLTLPKRLTCTFPQFPPFDLGGGTYCRCTLQSLTAAVPLHSLTTDANQIGFHSKFLLFTFVVTHSDSFSNRPSLQIISLTVSVLKAAVTLISQNLELLLS